MPSVQKRVVSTLHILLSLYIQKVAISTTPANIRRAHGEDIPMLDTTFVFSTSVVPLKTLESVRIWSLEMALVFALPDNDE